MGFLAPCVFSSGLESANFFVKSFFSIFLGDKLVW